MIRVAFIFITVLLFSPKLYAQAQHADTVIMPDVVVMAQSRFDITYTKPFLVVYNRSPKNIDSLFLGCNSLGSLKSQDSIRIPYDTIKHLLLHAGVPIGEVQTKAPPCLIKDNSRFCSVYSSVYMSEKESTVARLEIIEMIDESGNRRLIWQRHK